MSKRKYRFVPAKGIFVIDKVDDDGNCISHRQRGSYVWHLRVLGIMWTTECGRQIEEIWCRNNGNPTTKKSVLDNIKIFQQTLNIPSEIKWR